MKAAPILVMVIVVALVNAAGVVLSRDGGNRGENAPTPVFVAARFIPTGTHGERIHLYLGTTSTTLPRKERLKDSIDDPQYLSGRVTIVDIHPGQQLMKQFFGFGP